MADLRKSLTKLKVVELKERIQEMGKTPKGKLVSIWSPQLIHWSQGLKADLVNQLAEAIEQSKGMADPSAPLQSYPTPAPQSLMTAESPESQYYQQPVGSYPMPAQQVYDQTQNYMQPTYEQQYQYPPHPVFSPTHEQQYSQSPAQYPMASQLSPRIASQMSPQLSPQMTTQLAPPIPPQMTQQLSPQMAAQQYRPADFQSPHRGFQSPGESEYNEYGAQTAPDQMSPYGIPHLDIRSMSSPQSAIPPTHTSHPSPQLVLRPQVIENYGSDLSQTRSLDQNIAPNMSAYKPGNEAFIPTHPSMVVPTAAPTAGPTDMIDFDDVSIAIDQPYNQQLGGFDNDQSQGEFELNDATDQFQRDVNAGQAFSQMNQLPDMSPNEDTNDTNGGTNEESTDVDSNESNQSFSNDTGDQTKSSFEGQQMVNEEQNQSIGLSNELPPELKKFDENSVESVQTDVDSVNDSNQYIQSNDNTNDYSDSQTNEEFVTKEESRPQVVQTFEQIDKEPEEQSVPKSQVMESVVSEEADNQKKVSEESNASESQIQIQTEDLSQKQQIVPTNEHLIDEIPEEKEPIVPKVSQDLSIDKQNEEKEMMNKKKESVEQQKDLSTTIEMAKEEVNQKPDVSSVQQNGIISDKKLTKNQKKKQRRKMRANRREMDQQKQKSRDQEKNKKEDDDKMDIDEEDEEQEIQIEYVPECIAKDPIYFQYIKVFDKFRTGETKRFDSDEEVYVDPVKKMMERKKPVELDLKDEDEKKDGEQKISKRKLKQMTRMSIADLKQRVNHPELVEMHDVTAKDPLLLLHLKATRNSVPVPRHWCYKRKYLQGKRGFEKPPFKLPEFIRKTGIMEMRQALQEKEESKSLKAQMREKIRPKMGKIDIDYQKLHDAFFKWQTKPKMTIHGDLYYEGKEFETRLKEKRPGELSTELRTALGMPTGPNAHKCPPPWLIAMQRYGPPPSYPNIKIPGLNAPIPESCSFGYHAGGWGKPPVDEYGRPLYGDVFGTASTTDQKFVEEEVDRTLWGEMDDESEEEEESSEEEEEPEAAAAPGKPPAKEIDESGFVTPAEGLVTPSGLSSIPAGLETPDMIELRKRKQIEAEMESGDNPALYTVIPEKKGDKVSREMMGSAHTYDMSATTLRKGQGVDVALDPSDLEAGALDSASVAARYEQTLKEQSTHNLSKGEDLSDMVAEHAARQKRKKQQDTGKSSKKYQFKF